MLTMGKNQLDAGPLHWQGLKASGFTGKILPGQTGSTGLLGENECDLAPDPGECEEERAWTERLIVTHSVLYLIKSYERHPRLIVVVVSPSVYKLTSKSLLRSQRSFALVLHSSVAHHVGVALGVRHRGHLALERGGRGSVRGPVLRRGLGHDQVNLDGGAGSLGGYSGFLHRGEG